MSILSDKTRNVSRNEAAFESRVGDEKRIEAVDKSLLATHEGHECIDIVRHIPRPLPSRTLTVVIAAVVGCTRIERFMPAALLVLTTHEESGGVEVVAESLALGGVFLITGIVAGSLGKLSDAPVVVGIFQTLGYRFPLLIPWNEAESVFVVFRFLHECAAHESGVRIPVVS